MKIILAGYNFDAEVIDQLKKHEPDRQDITPETISAAYARISRDPRPVDELRAVARAEVERARRSNQNIIFKMGHHSVAEHAVFNFDLIGLSRLAIEEVEHFRLCSYTEKSQRYITLEGDYVLPEEIKSAGLEDVFKETIEAQNQAYRYFYDRLREHIFKKYEKEAANPKNHPVLDGWAKEDARYVVSLATKGQLGMTVNARNLELMIRRFAARKNAEIQELVRNLHDLAKKVAPSIILFTEPSPYEAEMMSEVGEEATRLLVGKEKIASQSDSRKKLAQKGSDVGKTQAAVRLIESSEHGDELILAGLIFSTTGLSFESALRQVRRWSPKKKLELVKKIFEHMEFYDSPPREFELAYLTYDLIVSASCFAQLKRHRMMTLLVQPYDPALGVTVPPSIKEIKEQKRFMEVIKRTEKTWKLLKEKVGPAADYILTNAHRRRVLVKANVRELYHLSRLREDATAQWEIRQVSTAMSALARKTFPLSASLLGGKDAYPELYRKLFSRLPKMQPPTLFV
ncbi:MAG: FAD-dependent thymidylate synthase [Candidatus Aminicenantes bacterium]|nr:FAD-dependent thymidylate synthase [Candidatus Aminicenantes bacterium]